MSNIISAEDFSEKDKEFIQKIEKELQKEKASKLKYVQENENYLPNINFYNKPVHIYLMYKKNRKTFKQIYTKSKLQFYISMQKKIIFKFIRKTLPFSLISLILTATALHILSISGFYKILRNACTRLRNLFSRNKLN